jgi:Domain of unknown function (DUF4394)
MPLRALAKTGRFHPSKIIYKSQEPTMLKTIDQLRRTTCVAALGASLLCAAAGAHAESLIGLTSTNALATFDTATPANGTVPVTITGLLGANETILGIDRRPANGLLYGVGSSGRIYTLNTSTGAATFAALISGATLSGTAFWLPSAAWASIPPASLVSTSAAPVAWPSPH